jgi:hypothetical protein
MDLKIQCKISLKLSTMSGQVNLRNMMGIWLLRKVYNVSHACLEKEKTDLQ